MRQHQQGRTTRAEQHGPNDRVARGRSIARRAAAAPSEAARRASPPAPQELLARARSDWFHGEFESSLDLAERARREARGLAPEAALLRARVLLRLYRHAEAVRELDALVVSRDPDERATRDMLLGAALHRSEDARGWTLLRSAATAALHPGVRAESALFMAQAYWAEKKLDDAEALLERTLDPSTGIIYARGLELFGWIEDARERYGIATRHFLEALAALDEAPNGDAYMRAGLLQILGSYAVAIPDLRLGRIVRREAASAVPASGLVERWFYLRHNLGMIALLEGDPATAWDHFEATLSRAGSDARRTVAHTALAEATRAGGDSFSASRHLGAAFSALRRHDWREADPDDRTALLDFAVVAAATDASASRAAFDLWSRSEPEPNRAMALHADRRVEALRLEADGASRAALGKRDGAALLAQAQALWRSLGLRHYEARAAFARFRSSRSPDALGEAAAAVRAAPYSTLKALIDAAAGVRGKADALTPAERRVMLAICAGKTAPEMAASFGRSVNTVRNQTRKVFATMEVRSRSQLVAECARLGLLPPAT